MMKGQFFIISTVIMISSLILITQYLYDYGKVDLAKIEQMQELNYIEDIQKSLTTSVNTACYRGDITILEKNLNLIEAQLKNKMLEKGIILNIDHHTISSCATNAVSFTVTMKSSEFYIENSFLV